MGLVLLVRHGQASFGADDYDVLSETGWTQGRLLGSWLGERGVQPSAVVHGELRRQRDTALALAEGAGWTDVEPQVDAGWDEFDHLGMVSAATRDLPDGDLDARGYQQIFEKVTARWTSGEHDGDFPETYAAFGARVRAALDRAIDAAGAGRTVVVVTSGGPIAVAVAALLDPEADPPALGRLWHRLNTVIVNSSVTRVLVGSTGARLLTYNEHPHLEADHLTYR